ncbi:disease resistance protein RGA2-like [Triticum dicoccoides]|uniref:disease resistance protein RGA2-like n=1 Tax=Triticum dicoccoides TaxID=85692 RepID=UPI00188ED4B1|nr:disease resistance protein RGA2-like [Triticum dicoccoides]
MAQTRREEAMTHVEGTLTSAMLENTAKKLRSAMGDESTKGLNVEGCLEEMMKTLEDIQAVMRDAVLRSEKEELVRGWLRQVRTKAYAVQDMVDELQETRTATAGTMTKMLHCLGKKDHRISNKMKEMKHQLVDMHKESHDFGFTPADSDANIQPVIDVPETAAEDEYQESFVERYAEVKHIVHLLGERDVGEGPIILAVVGIGGVGKTALVDRIFNHPKFHEEYHSRAWVNVPYKYDLDRIGQSIISQLSGEAESPIGDMEYIKKRLRELFNGMKILLILDDLREKDSIQLECLKSMLSVGDKDSKVTVMVTTRSREIGMIIGTTDEPFTLGTFSPESCMKLLKLKTYFSQRTDWQRLNAILHTIAFNCQGLPLVIYALGWILRYKDARFWEVAVRFIRDDYSDEDDSPSFNSILPILHLTYLTMPVNMRLCFAYCGIFPMGHSILKYDLIHQWIALGLIESTHISSATQLAEEYISSLLSMSFLQPMYSNYGVYRASGKDAILFTMNDVFHEFAREIMHNEVFVLDVASASASEPNEYFRYALLTNHGYKPRTLALLSSIRALHCDQSFSFPRHLRVLQLKESSLQKLPDSLCQLRHLGYLNLAGCSGLETLPESLGDLTNMCHINLSGCTGLVNLPQSFGDLINLLHVDLSRCYGLTELPVSFGNLKKLEYLDLSFWSCFKGIVEVLGGLINVKRLNLSQPCCHLADHWHHLSGLKDVWGKLPELRYLNLSMFFNLIFYQLPEDVNLNKYVECISGLSSLEYLDLSHNIFLVDIPESLAKLNKLHTLDLSGCARLKRVDKWMADMGSLKSLIVRNCQGLESYQFVVHTDDHFHTDFFQLNNVSCKELEIICPEKVKYLWEAHDMKLMKKQELEKLKLCWTKCSEGSVDDTALLGELVPPPNLQYLELHGYHGETCFPAWWTSSKLPNLVKVIMEDLPRCLSLPPLRLLPSLQELVLRKMASITRIDDAGDLSGGNRVPFNKVELDDMDSLEMFNTTWYTNELVIQKCSKLVLGPLPPRAQRLVISDCDQVMSSWRNQGSR